VQGLGEAYKAAKAAWKWVQTLRRKAAQTASASVLPRPLLCKSPPPQAPQLVGGLLKVDALAVCQRGGCGAVLGQAVHHRLLQALLALKGGQEVAAGLHVLQLDVLPVRQQHCGEAARRQG
jgi:hypothetical protein